MPSLPEQECRRRFAGADHAYLATAGHDLLPHVVPVVVAVLKDRVVFAVDRKPKRTTGLRRLRNIRDNPRVAFLADHYARDWDRLWWVRADATARVVEAGPDHRAAVAALRERHAQYRDAPPEGPAVLADVVQWTGWSASPLPEQP